MSHSKSSKPNVIALVILRGLFFSLFIFLIDKSISFGTSPVLLSFAALLGVGLSTRLAFSHLNFAGFGALYFIFYATFALCFFIISEFGGGKPGWFFIGTVVENHVMLFLHVFTISSVLTWLFWRLKAMLTLEIIGLTALALHLLSGHRNFHFESPRILNDLAWHFGLQPLTMLLVIGACILILVALYIYIASLTNRLHFAKNTSTALISRGRRNYLVNGAVLGVVGLTLFFICNELFDYYYQEALSRTTNGVGQESEGGVSPLDFHSALGSTNQPAALVRLEGDYNKNPFLPMLYLREGALSQFNGKEMVISESGFDLDVNATTPDQAYKIEPLGELGDRIAVAQTVYLLADHKLAFAIDYPISINQMQNPNAKRFKSAYRARSLAPVFPLESIKDAAVGNPDWPASTRKHYLQTHGDSRYADLAMKITNSYSATEAPRAEKAFRIIQYLSKNAIYTLTPNHEVKANEDPVAPFLFGDLRGYCVHFAHATVYMLRALGIPSRIATGYLTDLSQARDGHILLRMSDRHAWAEVYIEGHGWVPFDTQPERVESHADTQIDMQLLEELMGMLDPGEEILPEDILKDEIGITPERAYWTPTPAHFYILISLLLGLLLIIKLYLRYGWALSVSPEKRLRRSYISIASRLIDLGLKRRPGETRQEFKERLLSLLGGPELFGLTDSLVRYNYAAQAELSNAAINEQRRRDLRLFKKLPLKDRITAVFNPSSALSLLSGGRW